MIKAKDIQITAIKDLKLNPKNRNKHPKEQIERLQKLIEYQGFRNPVIVSNQSGFVVVGHGRVQAAKKLGIKEVPVIYQDFDDETQEQAYLISDNAIASWAELDLSEINVDIQDMGPDFDIDLLGIQNFEIEAADKYADGEKGSMTKNFIAPPFSVLDTKQDYWQKRRDQWLSLGIKSEEGRIEGVLSKGSNMLATVNKGTSIFDPVLAEIAYTWFCPSNGIILDCFAGGSVRGIVASHIGRQYIGVELRQEQVDANRAQEEIAIDPKPVWHCGNSLNIEKICEDVKADFVFSCPPYADLEVYSDNAEDLSNMSYETFLNAYRNIIRKTTSLLKDNSFACFVVGEVRNKDGIYYNFVNDTIKAFIDAGLDYYNEIILVNSAGTLPLRAGRSFKASRKIGKMHQNVLVFVKGCPKLATERVGEINVMESDGSDE